MPRVTSTIAGQYLDVEVVGELVELVLGAHGKQLQALV